MDKVNEKKIQETKTGDVKEMNGNSYGVVQGNCGDMKPKEG